MIGDFTRAKPPGLLIFRGMPTVRNYFDIHSHYDTNL